MVAPDAVYPLVNEAVHEWRLAAIECTSYQVFYYAWLEQKQKMAHMFAPFHEN